MLKVIPHGSNQTLLKFGRCEVLYSYQTPVAGFDGLTWFRTEEKFSITTTKHINKYLDGLNAEVVPQDYIEGLVL